MRLHANNIAPILFALGATAVVPGFLSRPLLAQEQPPASTSLRIRDIRVEGAQASSPAAIISFSGLRSGDVITANSDAIAKAIRNIFDRRLFSDVNIFYENPGPDGATVVIVVKEYPRIGAITFEGNDEFDEKDLTEVVTVQPGQIASPYEIDRSRAKIKSKYAEEGYLFTKSTALRTPSADTGRIDIRFNIDEGPEVKIGEITFRGNSAFDESDLEGAMEDVMEKSWWQIWRSSKFDRKALKQDEKRVVDFYRSEGYIDAEVVGDSIMVDEVTGRADIRIDVSEGNRVYLRSLALTGNTVYDNTLIAKRLDVEVGAPYNQTQLEKNVHGNEEQTDLKSLYLDNGYLQFNAQINESRATRDSVDVVLRMTEGGQSSIRYVSIAGNSKTKDKVIRRELYTRPGDTFSKAAVIRSLRSLANLNYFNPERLQPDVQPVDATTVDITYQVEERPSDTFNASLGLSSQGITGMLGVSFNNFSLLEPLSGGGGQILNFNWEFGTYQKTFSLGLTEPWLFDDPTSLGASIYYQTRDFGSLATSASAYTLRQIGGSLNLGRRLRWPDDYFRADMGINFRRNDITGNKSSTLLYNNGTELSLGLTLSRSSIDNPIFPTVGSRFVLSNTLAGLGDAEYTKHELKFEFFSPLAHLTEQNPLVFYLSNEFGYLNDYGQFENIPPISFYSMGGTSIGSYNVTPLRGYRDGSIGPVQGDIAVGQVYSKTSAEMRFGIALNPIPIYILAFAEAGNVWRRFSEVDPFDLKRSAGIGLRLTVPGVGLLGFDYGYGFDLDSYGRSGSWQFHFQFGR